MLTREQAEKRLGEFRVEDWADQRLTRLARLPADACELGRAMLDPLSPRIWGSFARHDQQDALEKCSAHLERLTTAERRDLVGSLFPKLVEHIERGWRMVASQTYQSDLSRKAFRAPTYDELVHGRRLTWLLGLIHNLKGYDPDIAWLAAWTPHLGYFLSDLSLLLAAAIDACGTEGEQIFQILVDSANGVHDVGQMGHHVVESLLMAGRTDGWEFIEKLLVAAQRQEGLRQSILERADVAHPQAFRRILRVILEHGLARFSATVRALNVWLGYQWDAVSVGKVNAVIEKLLLFLEDDAARMKALDDGDAEDAYLALWTIAHTDAMQAIPIAAKLLKDTSVERRIVGSHMLAMLDLEEAAAALLPALDDKDLRVAARALSAFGPGAEEYVLPTDLFAALERLIARAPPRKKKLPAIVWPWFQLEVAQVEVARTMRFAVAGQAPKLLIPHLRAMDLYNRAATVEKIAEQETWDADTRKTILAMLSDASARVREESLKAMNGRTIEPAEAPELESLLTRKAPTCAAAS